MKSLAIEKPEQAFRQHKLPLTIALLIGVGLAILTLALLVQLAQGSVIWLCVRAIFQLLPVWVWLAGTAVSLCWLVVVTRLWQG